MALEVWLQPAGYLPGGGSLCPVDDLVATQAIALLKVASDPQRKVLMATTSYSHPYRSQETIPNSSSCKDGSSSPSRQQTSRPASPESVNLDYISDSMDDQCGYDDGNNDQDRTTDDEDDRDNEKDSDDDQGRRTEEDESTALEQDNHSADSDQCEDGDGSKANEETTDPRMTAVPKRLRSWTDHLSRPTKRTKLAGTPKSPKSLRRSKSHGIRHESSEPESGGIPLGEENMLPQIKACERYQREFSDMASTKSKIPNDCALCRFLKLINEETRTTPVATHTMRALIQCTDRFQCPTMNLELLSDTPLATPLLALICLIWLVVVQKASLGSLSTRNKPIWTTCFTLAFSAASIIARFHSSVSLDEVTGLMAYWEQFWFCSTYPTMDKEHLVDWSAIDWWKELPLLDGLCPEPDLPQAHRYLKAWDRHWYSDLVDALVDDELSDTQRKASNFFKTDQLDATKSTACQILTSMDPDLLEACIKGNLPYHARRKGDRPVSMELCRIRNISNNSAKNTHAPSIYANFVTDRAGMPMSPAMLELLLDDMERYVNLNPSTEDNNWSTKVDQQFPATNWDPSSNSVGFRKYLDRPLKGKIVTQNDRRRQHVWYFIRTQRQYVGRYVNEHRALQPFAMALTEVGFTSDPKIRLRSHRKHQSSNLCMMILVAVARLRFDNHIDLHQELIYLCWHDLQSGISEIILTRLMHGYSNINGFSFHRAGLSNLGDYVNGKAAFAGVLKDGVVEDRCLSHFQQEMNAYKAKIEREKARVADIGLLLQGLERL